MVAGVADAGRRDATLKNGVGDPVYRGGACSRLR